MIYLISQFFYKQIQIVIFILMCKLIMLGQILSSITQNFDSADPLTQQLLQENLTIRNQMLEIEDTLELVPMKSIATYIESHDPKFRPLLKQQNAELKLSILQQFYFLASRGQESKRICQHLMEQINNISNLIKKNSLYDYLKDEKDQYDEQKASQIKTSIARLEEEIISWQNIQNTNKLEFYSQQICQQWNYTILFLEKCREVIIGVYQSMVNSIYKITQSSVIVNQCSYLALWNQQQSFILNFILSLESFFQNFITYQVNDKQYYLKVYHCITSDNTFGIKQHSHLVFDCSQVSLHYETINQSIQQFCQFFNLLSKRIPKEKSHLISDLRKRISTIVREYFQYLMPFLTMNMRKKLIAMLSSQQEASNLTIYQLLVNLKLTGQDADSLVDIIKQMTRKAIQYPDNIAAILKFIEMAKSSRKNFNMLFFLTDQLIDQFQSQIEVTPDIAEHIKQLLEIREDIREKIHQGEIME